MLNFDPAPFVLATRQQREREAEQYRLTHPQLDPRPSRSPRRDRPRMHLPHLSTLLHPHRHTPRILG